MDGRQLALYIGRSNIRHKPRNMSEEQTGKRETMMINLHVDE